MQAPIEVPNFELLEEIGRGGMARVYLARQLEPKRQVAMKIVSPGASHDEAFMQSLKLEGDMAAQCNHPNIVTVYACGVIDHHYYLAMEHLGDGDLTKKIEQGVSEQEALKIMSQMASALEEAHSMNLLHRDIKPENIMFHNSGRAVLVDFGIAKESDTESNFTKAGAVVGTPHYMSPERATGKPTDARSDLYALGVVFYEMLTGKKLYEGADTFAISYAHVYEPIPLLEGPLAKHQALLNKLVAKDPEDRFQNASALLEALERPETLPAADPSTNATMAVSPSELASSPAAAPAASATPEQTEPQAKSGLSMPVIGAIAATLILVAVAAFVFLGSDSGGSATASGDNLTTEQRVRMQELLQSAATFTKIGNYEQAQENLIKVMTEYDCKNQEARRGLKAIDPGKAENLIASCDG